jgi:hypothetical protein
MSDKMSISNTLLTALPNTQKKRVLDDEERLIGEPVVNQKRKIAMDKNQKLILHLNKELYATGALYRKEIEELRERIKKLNEEKQALEEIILAHGKLPQKEELDEGPRQEHFMFNLEQLEDGKTDCLSLYGFTPPQLKIFFKQAHLLDASAGRGARFAQTKAIYKEEEMLLMLLYFFKNAASFTSISHDARMSTHTIHRYQQILYDLSDSLFKWSSGDATVPGPFEYATHSFSTGSASRFIHCVHRTGDGIVVACSITVDGNVDPNFLAPYQPCGVNLENSLLFARRLKKWKYSTAPYKGVVKYIPDVIHLLLALANFDLSCNNPL